VKFLETAAFEAGLADPFQRAEALRQVNILLLRLHNHSLWHEIDEADERYHEVPYSYLRKNSHLDTGYFDLLYCSDEGWQIIDFKSDALRSAAHRQDAIEKHRPQMRRYVHAAQTLLHQPVRVRLCFLDDDGQVSLVEIQ
jgi:ATP-dependent exoDNAse (exonuclease V) beta subunit